MAEFSRRGIIIMNSNRHILTEVKYLNVIEANWSVPATKYHHSIIKQCSRMPENEKETPNSC